MKCLRRIALLGIFATVFLAGPGRAQSITTLFAGSPNAGVSSAVYFDLTVNGPAGMKLLGVDANFAQTAGTPAGLAIYTTPGTAVGRQTSMTAWTLRGNGNGVAAGPNGRTFVDLPNFNLAPGSYGIALVAVGVAHLMTLGNGSNQSYATREAALALGSATAIPFAGAVLSPRVWNGTIYYAGEGNDISHYGVYGLAQTGCVGTNGRPQDLVAALGSVPRIGATLTLRLENLHPAAAGGILFLGSSKTVWMGVPLPFGLTGAGLSQCQLVADPSILLGFVPNLQGMGVLLVPIPNSPSLRGVEFYNQAFILDASANRAGLVATNGGEGAIGR